MASNKNTGKIIQQHNWIKGAAEELGLRVEPIYKGRAKVIGYAFTGHGSPISLAVYAMDHGFAISTRQPEWTRRGRVYPFPNSQTDKLVEHLTQAHLTAAIFAAI